MAEVKVLVTEECQCVYPFRVCTKWHKASERYPMNKFSVHVLNTLYDTSFQDKHFVTNH